MENWEKWLSEGSDEWKTAKNGFPRPRMSGKLKKMCFQPLGEPKNAENAHRRLTKRRNREKTLIVGRRNAKNAEKCSSSVDEMRKTPKNVRRRSTKRRNREKTLIVGRRNAENAEKQSFVPLRRAKNAENRVS